jgi:hypothetical protein
VSRLIVAALFLITASAPPALSQSVTDNITIKRWEDFKSTVGVGLQADNCPQVNDALHAKLTGYKFGSNDVLTDEEFVSLVGDQYEYFGIFGGREFYDRQAQKMSDPLGVYAKINGITVDDPANYTDPAKNIRRTSSPMISLSFVVTALSRNEIKKLFDAS